jgi:hypothetical protein
VSGDSLARSLDLDAVTGGSFLGGGIRGTTVGKLGCGISSDRIAIDAFVFGQERCADWRDWIDLATTAYSPHVAVLMVGPSEVFDRFVFNTRLKLGTRELEAHLRSELNKARDAATEHGARLILTTIPCMEPPARPPSAFKAPLRDQARIAWFNQVWRDYARRHPDVQLLDLAAFLCPNGVTRRLIDGQSITAADGTSLNRRGALATWKFIADAAKSKPTPDVDEPLHP